MEAKAQAMVEIIQNFRSEIYLILSYLLRTRGLRNICSLQFHCTMAIFPTCPLNPSLSTRDDR